MNAGKNPQAAPNTLARQFNVPAPNISWVTDITYIRTQEGWLYLAMVLDLFSRKIVGWAMKSRMTADLAVDALLMAVWRRKPKQPVLVHSDQGSQFTGGEWQDFLKAHNLSCSMSRRGNCLYGDGIHLTVAHKREWSYGFKPDNKTVPLPCYLESPYDHQRESSTSQTQPARACQRAQ
ncbi:IS3 family transposase [Aeromonas jandaei]|uniref:IS3 family transposase n=1 Tax=Aeromonas jandaei TaxID=650 RepID=UPI0021F121D6|nr:IS3 family transposase [Aeromonas jandaei]